jgi:hypothetical protein
MSDIIRGTPLDQYALEVDQALELIMANGTVPILATITPHREKNDEVLRANEALRNIARQRLLPIVDVYAELERRSANIFDFLEEDGVHLTANVPEGPATEENFLKCGYLLRCYLIVRKGLEVKEKVLDGGLR